MDRIERSRYMEIRLNRADSLLAEMERVLDAYEKTQEDLRVLSEYYLSTLWKEDLEADEAGALPPDLNRGVLSEDGIYDLLERNKELKDRMRAMREETDPLEKQHNFP